MDFKRLAIAITMAVVVTMPIISLVMGFINEPDKLNEEDFFIVQKYKEEH